MVFTEQNPLHFSSLCADNKTIQYFRECARAEALKSTIKNRCGAVLVYKGEIISGGYNYSLLISTANKYGLLCT
jgi:deoxycytidylate deaminase